MQDPARLNRVFPLLNLKSPSLPLNWLPFRQDSVGWAEEAGRDARKGGAGTGAVTGVTDTEVPNDDLGAGREISHPGDKKAERGVEVGTDHPGTFT